MTLAQAADPVTVDVSAFGRFHAYRLATEMYRHGALGRLYTSYPKAIDGIDRRHVSNTFALKAIEHAVCRVAPEAMRPATWRFFSRRFDRSVAGRLEGGAPRRVLHGWSTQCLETLRAAHAGGTATAVDCSSAHPAFTAALLKDESERVGVPYTSRPMSDRVAAECAAADRIVVPSSYVERTYLAAGHPRSRVAVVPLGADVTEIAPATERDAGQPFRVLMVGTDALQKAPYDLLMAWRRLRLPDAELVIRCDVNGKAAELLNDRGVRYIPAMSRAALLQRRLYQQATVFCLPSIQDGFGMVVLEAMAAGLPVIVTEHVGAADLVTPGVNGYVVPIRDPDAIAERLQHLYDRPELVREMGRNARRVAERFTWSRYGDAMLRLYRGMSPS